MPEVFTKSPGAPKPPETRPSAVWRPVEANLFGKPHKAYLINTPDSITYISPSALVHQIQGSSIKEGDKEIEIKGIFATSTPRDTDIKVLNHKGRNSRFVVYDLSRVHRKEDIRFKVITSPHKPVGVKKETQYYLVAVDDVPSEFLIPQVTIGQPLDWRNEDRTARNGAMSVQILINSLLIVTGDLISEPDNQFPKLTELDPAFIATNRIPKLSEVRNPQNNTPLSAGW